MGTAAIMAASLAVSAYSTYQQNQQSQQANANAQGQVQQQENAEGQANQSLQDQTAQNNTTQKADAQWMQMRALANTMQGASGQPPSSLLAGVNSNSAGAQAGARAGRV